MNRPSPTAPNATGVVGTSAAQLGAAQLGADLSQPERLSALVDGELDVASEAALWREDTDSLCDTWSRYQLIGETLRGARPQAPDDERVASIMLRVRQERVVSPDLTLPAPTQLAPAPAQVVVGVSHDAANDSIFRWKMLAGFASLAAVVAVAWNMNASVDGNGPQLAQVPAAVVVSGATPVAPQAGAPAASTPVLAASTEAAPAVVAEAAQGPVLRDARLEELMAAHRQAGGMSALQMPAGFLRNAAFDAPEGQR